MTEDQRVLGALDWLLSDDFCAEIELELARGRIKGREKSMAKKLELLYKIAHGFNRSNACYRVHGDWRKEIKGIRKAMTLKARNVRRKKD